MGQKIEISFLDSIYTDRNNDIRASYPINLVPIVATNQNGMTDKYLRITEGIQEFILTDGVDRGGINWNGKHFRVLGTKLVFIDKIGTRTEIADVGAGNDVVFDYSFDYLAINSGKSLYLYDGEACKKVSDNDLGQVNDVVFMDGYFITTDGESIVTTDIADPFSVSPFNYGSSEADPDGIIALYRINKELYAVNRYTVEAFGNVGGDGFPFRRIDGATISKGAVSRGASCAFLDSICFVGSGKNEPLSIYLATSGSYKKISNRDIDLLLSESKEEEIIKNVTLEARSFLGHDLLYLHFKEKTLVYDFNVSNILQKPIWYQLNSGVNPSDMYLARNFVWVYDKWFVGNPKENKIGFFTDDVSTHWGKKIRWSFDTQVIFNQGNGVIVNAIEITTVSSSIALGSNPTVAMQISHDAIAFGEQKFIFLGLTGQRVLRAIWRRLGYINNIALFRFSGDSEDRISIMRLDAEFEVCYI